MGFRPNKGKSLIVEVAGRSYARLPVRTHVITAADDLTEILKRYVQPHLRAGDMVLISERVVAITQGRAFPIRDIKPSRLARFLVRFVRKSPYGIGLGSPWTMELAIREAGVSKILFAALASALTKPLGVRGVFYLVCGKGIAAIDGPCAYTLPPYNEYAKLGPDKPYRVARTASAGLGCDVAIIDANDLGVSVLGKSCPRISDRFIKELCRDNPLGQSTQRTPLCIVRRAARSDRAGPARHPARLAHTM